MKVIYTECSNLLWLDVADNLYKQFGWEPVYWSAHPDFEDVFTGRFPQACFHSNIDAVRGIYPPKYKSVQSMVLDRTTLDDLVVYQIHVLKMMDRIEALGSFTYQERVRHYYRLVGYWLAILEETQPDLVFFRTIPHMVYDYVLYGLCQTLKIPTLMYEVSNVMGLGYLRSSIHGNTILKSKYLRIVESGIDVEASISQELSEYLNSLRGDYQNLPIYIRYVSKDEIYRQSGPIPKIKKWLSGQNLKASIEKQRKILISKFQAPDNYLKQQGKVPEGSSMSNIEYGVFRHKARKTVAELARYYHSLALKTVDLERPYIFVALSYQPEATTSPKGNIFVNMSLMVEMLSKLIPDHWVIYVKEHPSQFEPTWAFRAHSARSKYFYDDLASLKNVNIIPTSFSSYDLIDHSNAVATTTGTVGWQAVNRLKPAFVFGTPWYDGCEGVFTIQTKQNCLDAIEKVKTGYKVDGDKVGLFALALEKIGQKLVYEIPAKNIQLPKSATAEAIAMDIESFYSQYAQAFHPNVSGKKG
jgi:hypothetical protein